MCKVLCIWSHDDNRIRKKAERDCIKSHYCAENESSDQGYYMKVYINAFGLLKKYFGDSKYCLEIPKGSTMYDLMNAINGVWGEKLPPYLWDSGKKRFRGSVVIMIQKKAVTSMETLLKEGQEVNLYKVLAGG